VEEKKREIKMISMCTGMRAFYERIVDNARMRQIIPVLEKFSDEEIKVFANDVRRLAFEIEKTENECGVKFGKGAELTKKVGNAIEEKNFPLANVLAMNARLEILHKCKDEKVENEVK